MPIKKQENKKTNNNGNRFLGNTKELNATLDKKNEQDKKLMEKVKETSPPLLGAIFGFFQNQDDPTENMEEKNNNTGKLSKNDNITQNIPKKPTFIKEARKSVNPKELERQKKWENNCRRGQQ